MKTTRIISALFLCSMLAACIKNDIPFPHIEGIIREIAFEGQEGDAVINTQNRTVQVTLGEDAILSDAVITKLVTNEEATISPLGPQFQNISQFPQSSFTSLEGMPGNVNTHVDATTAFSFLLTTYQEYLWTVYVTQNLTRSIELEHQMGESIFDVSSHTAIAYIETGKSLTDVHISSMKLEGGKCTIEPDPTTVHDFTRPREFTVIRDGKIISKWIVDVQYSEIACATGSVDAWARRATLNGSMKRGATPVVEYREAGSEEWITLDKKQVTEKSSVSFSAQVTGLKDGTSYEWRVMVNGEASPVAHFETEKIQPIPNLGFDVWSQKGRNWYPNPVPDNYDDPMAYWASGNEGVTSTLAGNRDPITQPVTGSDAYKGTAARMVSLTGVPLVGSAAGNLFIGKYKTNVNSPKDSPQFGRPFSGARPDGLRGYYKYKPMPITNGTYPGNLTMDECHIYMKIWDKDGNLIGYGEHVGKEEVKQYIPFEFRLEYTSPNAKPAQLTIVATSSRYGGDFEGAKVAGQVGDGSTLWVDEFEVIYE